MGILLTNKTQIEQLDLNVIVVEILSWLRLEHKRSIWISEGRRTCHKPLEINIKYPWYTELCMLVEKEDIFHNYFIVKDGKLDFADTVKEADRIVAREKVYKNYIPQMHI